jgi:hypothetical protein
MRSLILQNIVEDIPFDSLPLVWRNFDLKSFSMKKTLWDFQQKGIENAVKALWLYYQDKFDFNVGEDLRINEERKKYLFELYKANGLDVSLDYSAKREKKNYKLLSEYYSEKDGKIEFFNFINRMSFWMATGSGKTLIIVKLLEVLKKLMESKEIPANDILILTHRDDLLDQLKKHVYEFSSYQKGIVINLKSLKEYDKVKREVQSLFKEQEITVFYYRSDLISDEQKEKILDFRNYDNEGRWYILLDEAHKGDKEESKRQVIYSILTRNGFLFNFSATFVDPRDFATCVFNFNLERFINEGYGKHIYLSQEEAEAFRSKEDFTGIEKQKIVLKNLILLTYLQKFFRKLRKIEKGIYHKPLLLTLVNSVNVEEADLELFFREIEKIGKGEIKKRVFKEAKKELLEGLERNKKFEFEENEFEIDKKIFEEIEYRDILEEVYNSKTPGNIEVLVIPGNRQELIFKLKTSEKPFASIKIGDITNWLKEKLKDCEINESFDNESVFKRIDRDDSDINILMGSRAFYEGWDSNRPNLILFINIGIGKDAKKFVQQSVGRGVRIEPVKDKRKRLLSLFNSKEISEKLFSKIENLVLPIETLSIAGTKRDNLKEIIATFKEIEEKSGKIVPNIEINKEIQKHPLFIPVYKPAPYSLAKAREPQKFSINSEDFELAKSYIDYLEDPRVFLMYHDADLETYKIFKESFKRKEDFYKLESQTAILEPKLITNQILNHLSLIPKEFDKFKKLEEEIVHFKKIKFLGEEKFQEFLEGVEKVKSAGEKERKLEQLKLNLKEGEIDVDTYTQEILTLDRDYPKEVLVNSLRIKYVPNYYYFPLLISEKDKIDYINHIISEPSEVKFIKNLEKYLEKEDNLFKKFDWWFFSKIDETTDNVYLPYYDPNIHAIREFKPDFIFWLCKGKKYYILFVDPKSRTYTDYEHKVDWYKRIFEEGENPKTFSFQNYKIKVILSLYCDDKNRVSEGGYKKYWFDNIEKLLKQIIERNY